MGNRKGDMFDTWMKQQSDLVQATAMAFAEREVLEASLRGLDDVSLACYPPADLPETS